MNRWMPMMLCLLAVAAIGQAPLPTPAKFAWDLPAKVEPTDSFILQWPGGSQLFDSTETNYTVANFPLGVANPVSIYTQSMNGSTSPSNTIYVLNVRAVFEEADNLEGPWNEGPSARVLVERRFPRGWIRVRLEIQ